MSIEWIYPIFEQKEILLWSFAVAIAIALFLGKLGRAIAMIIVMVNIGNILHFLVYLERWIGAYAHNEWGFGRDFAITISLIPPILIFIIFIGLSTLSLLVFIFPEIKKGDM